MNKDDNDLENLGITFDSFVASLATQALMQLGEIPVPPGIDVSRDRQAAKNTIDILTMLKRKTKGNLTDREIVRLDELLHNLRLKFVKRSSE